MKKRLVVGNWKMNPEFVSNSPEADDMVVMACDFTNKIQELNLDDNKIDVVICPPIIGLQYVSDISDLSVGAQNGWPGNTGAYTGEVSMKMIYRTGVEFVIVGHSERRRYHGETDELINQKIKSALEYDLIPIICVGENIKEQDTEDNILMQLKNALKDLSPDEISKVVIAYEPVWAIGTGDTATPEYASEMIKKLRNTVSKIAGNDIANEIRVIYGGSVTAENATGFAASSEIDGALVGGASLDSEEFAKIVSAFN